MGASPPMLGIAPEGLELIRSSGARACRCTACSASTSSAVRPMGASPSMSGIDRSRGGPPRSAGRRRPPAPIEASAAISSRYGGDIGRSTGAARGGSATVASFLSAENAGPKVGLVTLGGGSTLAGSVETPTPRRPVRSKLVVRATAATACIRSRCDGGRSMGFGLSIGFRRQRFGCAFGGGVCRGDFTCRDGGGGACGSGGGDACVDDRAPRADDKSMPSSELIEVAEAYEPTEAHEAIEATEGVGLLTNRRQRGGSSDREAIDEAIDGVGLSTGFRPQRRGATDGSSPDGPAGAAKRGPVSPGADPRGLIRLGRSAQEPPMIRCETLACSLMCGDTSRDADVVAGAGDNGNDGWLGGAAILAAIGPGHVATGPAVVADVAPRSNLAILAIARSHWTRTDSASSMWLARRFLQPR